MSEALRFFLVAEGLGLAALPLARLVLGRLPGRGYAWAKPLGLLAAAYPVWLIAHLGVVPFGTPLALAGALALAAAGVLLHRRRDRTAVALGATGRGSPPWRRIARPLAGARDRRLLIGAELVFAAAFALFAAFRAFAADVRGTEAPMDMAFLAAAHAADSFPPADPWQSGEDLNYYYLGHYLIAFVVRLAGVEPDAGYNLGLALLFALSAVAAYALGSSLTVAAGGRRPVLTGVGAAFAVCLAGNLDAAQAFLAGAEEQTATWFGPSRVIPDTINEFPAFSFVLGDLHAHVLAIPFTLLALGFALQVALTGPRARDGLAAGVVVGSLYAINSWSYPVTLALVAAGAVIWLRQPGRVTSVRRAASWAAGVAAVSVVAFLPFWLSFDPLTGGIGLVGERRSFSLFVRDQVLITGAFLWVLVAAFGQRLLGLERPGRAAAFGLVAAMVVGSLLAAVDDLAGVALLVALIAVAVRAALRRALAAERFGWLLIAGGLACVLVPEVVYVRDEFDGSPLYRMNTVFKLGYQAWILLAVVAAAILPWGRAWLPASLWRVWAPVAVVLLALTAIYPVAGAGSRTAGFADGPRVQGDGWLRAQAPGDVAAIDWLRENTEQDAVLLEAVGDDYSTFGHARISSFSGRSAVLGWPGHERQWNHDPGRRAADVRRLYRTRDPAVARALLDRYGIDYVVAGPLERADHGDAGLAKFAQLGERVLESQGTTLWRIRRGA